MFVARRVDVLQDADQVPGANLGAVLICRIRGLARLVWRVPPALLLLLQLQRHAHEDLVRHLLADVAAAAQVVDRQAPQSGIGVQVLGVGEDVPLSQCQPGAEVRP